MPRPVRASSEASPSRSGRARMRALAIERVEQGQDLADDEQLDQADDQARARSGPAPISVAAPNGRKTAEKTAASRTSLSSEAKTSVASERPGRLQQHALVDHREFEVRVGVVDRVVAGLGDDDDRQRRRREQVGRPEQPDPLPDAERR